MLTDIRKLRVPPLLLTTLLATSGCGGPPQESAAPPQVERAGKLRVQFPVSDDTDVEQVEYSAHPADASCDDDPIKSMVSPIETEEPPQSVVEGAGTKRRFADGYLVLAPGTYKICATPLTKDGALSQKCARAENRASVMAEATSEILIVSQCMGMPTGGLDAVVILNGPPHIDDLAYSPSKFITTCETAQISVAASDPNNDRLSYGWSITTSPTASAGAVAPSEGTAVFTPAGAGKYELKVVVTDLFGATATLTFPVYVSEGTCGCPADMIACGGTCKKATCSSGQPRDPMTCTCPRVNLALNPSCNGVPSPRESDRGWGGGNNVCQIVDGLHSYATWASGLAFTGGHYDANGGPPWIEPAGVRHIVIDFGDSKTWDTVTIWWHGVEHTPKEFTLERWDGTRWMVVEGVKREYGAVTEEGTNSGMSTSDTYTFAAVAGSKMRYSFDNSGLNIQGTYNIHGWVYEVEVFSAEGIDCE